MDTYAEASLPEYVLSEGAIEPVTLTPREKAVRDLFVDEYFKDFNYTRACTRVGFGEQDAITFALRFQYCPYVQGRIADRQNVNNVVNDDNELDLDKMRAKLINGLMEDAMYKGPGSSHAARVKAKSDLAKLLNMEPPSKTEQTVTVSNGAPEIDFDAMSKDDRVLLHKLLKSRANAE